VSGIFDSKIFMCVMTRFIQLVLGLAIMTHGVQEVWSQQDAEFEIPADLGFLRIVNATGYEGALWVTVNGVKLAAATGYEDGVATGAMGIQDKSLVVEMRHDTLGEIKQTVALKVGIITAMIAVAAVPEDGEKKGGDEGKESKPELVVHLLELPVSRSEEGSTLSLIQFSLAKQLRVDVGEKSFDLARGQVQTFPVTEAMGAFIDVKMKEQNVAQLNFKDAAGQGVVLYTTPKGVVKSTQFRNDVR
jgi:hypothetical protein